ncbi:MAG: NUMOD4 domain-containing protein [Crocinitomicaceae bacterium]|nr:NUMOD4 domain-containing protein [Crocinitomicaceae bacterium]
MELWKQIKGFLDYEISNYGIIRSLERTKKFKNGRLVHFSSKVKTQRIHPGNGFLMTDLIDNSGKKKTIYPHKLVASMFIKNDRPRKNKVVIHLDGNLQNNQVENLKWSSFSESIKIGFLTGKRDNSELWTKRRLKYGPKGGNSTMGRPDPLTENDKNQIFKLRSEKNTSLKELSLKFNCSVSHIHKTLNRIAKTA